MYSSSSSSVCCSRKTCSAVCCTGGEKRESPLFSVRFRAKTVVVVVLIIAICSSHIFERFDDYGVGKFVLCVPNLEKKY